MIASAALAATALGATDLPQFIESRVAIGSERFEYQLSDVDLDLRVDLLVTSAAGGERTLRLWRQRSDASFPSVPDWSLAVPPDVTCFSLLDLRPEPGCEIVLLTRGGVHSLTPTRAGLKDNLRREFVAPLFPDLADPQRLPCWWLTQDVDGDERDELLLVAEGELLILAVVDGALVERGRLPVAPRAARVSERGSFTIGGSGMRGSSPATSAFFRTARSSRPGVFGEKLLDRRQTFDLPRLLDFDGDAALERVEREGDQWFVTPLTFRGAAAPASSRVALPEAARDASAVEWTDVDGDGSRELLVLRADGDDKVALLFPARPDPTQPHGALIDPTPSARIKLAGMGVQYWLTDVDHDGRQDLTARVFDVPTGLSTLATVRLDTAFHVFRGQAGAAWSRAPELSFERSFRPEQLTRVQESLLINIGGDFDGDGCNDLVTTQLDGRVEIRRVTAGERLELETKPMVSFAPSATVDRLETWDLSRDGVADLTLRHQQSLTLFVSRGTPRPPPKVRR
jgi:hypothetical protein